MWCLALVLVAVVEAMAVVHPRAYDCVVAGGGPAGLAAGIELASLGWKTMVVEKRAAFDDFDKNKAFHYLIDVRGQRWTDRHGLTEELQRQGVPSANQTITRLFPDLKTTVVTPPLSAPQGIWIPRAQFLTVLAQKARATPHLHLRAGDALEILPGPHSQEEEAEEEEDANGQRSKTCRVRVGEDVYEPRILLGCDGFQSKTRDAAMPESKVTQLDSPSAGLLYKMVSVSSRFRTTSAAHNGDGNAGGGGGLLTLFSKPEQTYAVPSALKSRKQNLRLGFLPVRPGAATRTANIIRRADHDVWRLDPSSLRRFFADSFPQLASDFISDDELASFASARPGVFPKCQFATKVAAKKNDCAVFLLGDAAHAFPPDLGQGVNSALEDVQVLGDVLKKTTNAPKDNANAAVDEYQRLRAPAAEAIARIVQCGFPFQYSQAPAREKVFFVGFLLRLLLAKLVPLRRLCAPPVVTSVLQGRPYVDVWQEASSSTLFYKSLAAAALVASILRLFIII